MANKVYRVVPAETPKTFWAKLLDFIEHPLTVGALFAVGGLVGTLLYTPFLALCAVSVLLAFHRAKVVTGQPLFIQAFSYLLLVLILSVGGYFLYDRLSLKLDAVQTEFAEKVASFVKSGPVSSIPAQPKPTVLHEPPHTSTQRGTALGAFDNWLAGINDAPSMSDVFQHDFPNTMKLTDDAIGIEWKDSGTTTRIKRQLYLDFPANSKFVGFYIPTSDPLDPSRTSDACLKLVQADAVQQALDEMPKKTPILAGLGQTTTISDLTFSGRVVIYHDDFLSITQQADIIRAFAAKHYAVGFFGPNDFGKVLSSWHRLHDAKAANQ